VRRDKYRQSLPIIAFVYTTQSRDNDCVFFSLAVYTSPLMLTTRCWPTTLSK